MNNIPFFDHASFGIFYTIHYQKGIRVNEINTILQSRISIGDIILIFNIIIFITGAYLLSIEVAMYAILTYFVASKAITYIIEGIEEYTGVTIISDESEKIREMLVHDLGHVWVAISKLSI